MPACSTKNSRVTAGLANTVLQAYKWTVEVRADEIDVTNFESGGFTDYLTSYVDAMGTVDAFWDKDDNQPFDDPPQLLPGQQTNLTLYMHTDLLNYFRFPIAIILSSTVDAAVRDVVRYNFTFRNKGPFYYPGEISFTGITE